MTTRSWSTHRSRAPLANASARAIALASVGVFALALASCGGMRPASRTDHASAGQQSASDRAISPARTSDDELDGPTAPRRSPPPPVETRESPR